MIIHNFKYLNLAMASLEVRLCVEGEMKMLDFAVFIWKQRMKKIIRLILGSHDICHTEAHDLTICRFM